jgi:luciferase family oxidoreductase group 1
VGRAPGGTGQTTSALAYPNTPNSIDQYDSKAHQLEGFIHNSLPSDHPYQGINVLPDCASIPELWMLGSSGGSAALAGQLGYNIALARFINPDGCSPEIFAEHKKAWLQAGHDREPNKMLAIAAICAETEEEAKLRAGTAVYRKMAAQFGKRDDFLTPAEVRDQYQQWAPSMQATYDHILSGYTVGTAEQCWEEIHQLAREFSCEEISIVTVTHSQNDRLESYRLLGQAL